MRNTNRQWRLARYPEGLPRPDDWTLTEAPVPEPGPGELLLAARFLDVAPYMRGRISPSRNYAAGVAPGEVMIGGGVGEVVRSNAEGFAPGDLVVSDFDFGWQDYAVLRPAAVRRVDTALAPPECWLDVLGLNGITAYFGLLEAASMRAGDTVVVSAASGSVGQIVGQLAKIAGGRAIAVASTGDKVAACRELGFDDGIAYRETDDLAAALGRACPDGVDVYFDNTVGPILDAVLRNLATHARITICGTVSLAGTFGGPLQWVFDRTRLLGPDAAGGACLGVSLSAADDALDESKADLADRIDDAVGRVFPDRARARRTAAAVVKEPRATFRAGPGLAGRRPGPEGPIRGLALAGDWTDTGWPATMEGAVRSGEAAALSDPGFGS